jgi:hypothetical protein
MGLPPFSAPVERPVDKAVRDGTVDGLNFSEDVAASSSEFVADHLNNSGEDRELELVTFATDDAVGGEQFRVTVQVTDGDNGLTYVFNQDAGGFPITFDPPILWPDGTDLEIQVFNKDGTSHFVYTSVLYR